MTTAKNAVIALRQVRRLREQESDEPCQRLMYDRCTALDDLCRVLERYVASVETMLDDAYNRRARRERWLPTTLTCEVLRTKDIPGLHSWPDKNEKVIQEMEPFKALNQLARDLDVLFRMCVYEDRVTIVCDPISQKGRGTVEILFL